MDIHSRDVRTNKVIKMAARIVETDLGTKQGAVDAFHRVARHAPDKFTTMMWKYWWRVYQTALQEVPVDTGALRASIRIQRVKETSNKYVVGRTMSHVEAIYMILAGGGGIINPRHKREVDYARAVHDGHFTRGTTLMSVAGSKKKKKVGVGRWVPPNPFLTRAIQQNSEYLTQLLREYMDGKVKAWTEGGLPPAVGGVPTVIFNKSKYGRVS